MDHDFTDRMLTKKEVAGYLGMTVSWLNNSQSVMAQQIRSSRIRYGRSHSAPVRYPSKVISKILEEQGD